MTASSMEMFECYGGPCCGMVIMLYPKTMPPLDEVFVALPAKSGRLDVHFAAIKPPYAVYHLGKPDTGKALYNHGKSVTRR